MNEILINVLFLMVVLLVLSHIIETYTKKVVKISLFFISLISIYFCMTFPFPLSEEFNMDIRIVPFLIGSLYGGPFVSIGLYVCIVLYRFVIGFDLGFWGTIFNSGLIPIITFVFYKRFIKAGITQKLLISTGISTFHVLYGYVILNYISHTQFNIYLLGGLIKVACIILIILTIERTYINYQIRKKIIDIEKMEIISHLSASISHEIMNGLTGAKGFIQLLKEIKNDSQTQLYMGIALEELEKSEAIIRDFLVFANPAPEKIEKVNMEHLINDSIELIKPLCNMDIEIQKELSPFWIICEKRLIQQAIFNILKNSIEAMPNGGQLTIFTKSSEKIFEIIIKDTGFGMDLEQIERLGKPYYTTKGQRGIGLGMMVTYRVIQSLNGQITVTSQVRKGTTFTVSLPNSDKS